MGKWRLGALRRPVPAAIAVGAVALAIRLTWVAAMSRHPKGLSDTTMYLNFAREIGRGHGYVSLGHHPTAYYPPGYPYFLGFIQWMLNLIGRGGAVVEVVGVIQALLGGVTAALVVLLAVKVLGHPSDKDPDDNGADDSEPEDSAPEDSGSDDSAADHNGPEDGKPTDTDTPLRGRPGLGTGVVAGLIVAFWPNLVVYSSVLLSETLFLACLSALLLALVSIRTPVLTRVNRLPVAGSALLAGVCTLIRPQSTILVLLAVVVVWCMSWTNWRDVAAATLALIIGTIMVLSPWMVRNAVRMGSFIPLSSNTGENLCIGFNPDSTGGFQLTGRCLMKEKYIDGVHEEVHSDSVKRSRALSWITSHPGRLPGLGIVKLRTTFRNDQDGLWALESFGDDLFLRESIRNTMIRGANLYYFAVLGLAMAGVVLCGRQALHRRRATPGPLILLSTLVAGVAVPVLSFGDTRFKVPLAPTLAILAALTLSRIGTGIVGPPSILRDTKRRRDAGAVAIVMLLFGLPLPALFRAAGPPMEEGFMLAFPEQILHGRFPHRDFLHLYGPGSLYVLAAVFAIVGVGIVAERLVGLVQHAMVGFGLFHLLAPFGRTVATCSAAVAIVTLVSPGGLTALAWNGAIGLAVVALALGTRAATQPVGRASRRLLIASGICAGAALLYRPDLVLAVGIGIGAVVWDLDSERRRPIVVATLATLSLYIPHALVSGVGQSFRGMFTEPVFALRPGRRLPVPPSLNHIDGFLERVSSLGGHSWPLPAPSAANQIFIWFWLLVVVTLFNTYAAWRLRRDSRRSPQSTVLWPASLMGLALVPQALQRPDATHLAWVSGITFALFIPAATTMIERRRSRGNVRSSALLSAAALVLVMVLLIPYFPARGYLRLVGRTLGRGAPAAAITNGDRTFYFGDVDKAAQAQRIVDRLEADSSPGQRLIVAPADLSRTVYNDSFFYYLFPDLVPGTRFIEMDPGLANTDHAGLADDLRENDWLVLSHAYDTWDEPNSSVQTGSTEASSVVDDDYCPVLVEDAFELLRRCD